MHDSNFLNKEELMSTIISCSMHQGEYIWARRGKIRKYTSIYEGSTTKDIPWLIAGVRLQLPNYTRNWACRWSACIYYSREKNMFSEERRSTVHWQLWGVHNDEKSQPAVVRFQIIPKQEAEHDSLACNISGRWVRKKEDSTLDWIKGPKRRISPVCSGGCVLASWTRSWIWWSCISGRWVRKKDDSTLAFSYKGSTTKTSPCSG